MISKDRFHPMLLFVISTLLFIGACQTSKDSFEETPDTEVESPVIETHENVEKEVEHEEEIVPDESFSDDTGIEERAVGSSHSRSKSATIMVKGGPAPTKRADGMNHGDPGTIERFDNEPEAKAGTLTAGEWNDLNNWNDWKELLNNQDYNEMQEHWTIYPRSRYSVFVRNKYELPLQDLRVELRNKTGELIWSARTDNSGKAELWPDMFRSEKSFERMNAHVFAEGREHIIEDIKTIEEGVNHIDINMECRSAANVDVVFAVDATGSMSDEIRFLQSELQDVVQRAIASNTGLYLRLGSIFYRDSSDAYLTKVQPLSNDHSNTIQFMADQGADGGGDYPEAVDVAIDEALSQDWSENAVARIVFLLLDAPPHHNPTAMYRLQKQVQEASEQGIKIIPITASGINRQTEFLMKFMAIATNGTYVFITDHSGVGNPHLDPVVKDYEVEKLNDLLVRLLYNYTKSNGCDANEPATAGISIFPNPAKDYVNLTTDKPIRRLKLVSNSGKLISTRNDINPGENKISLAGLIDGIYTIQCEGDNVDFSQPIVVINR